VRADSEACAGGGLGALCLKESTLAEGSEPSRRLAARRRRYSSVFSFTVGETSAWSTPSEEGAAARRILALGMSISSLLGINRSPSRGGVPARGAPAPAAPTPLDALSFPAPAPVPAIAPAGCFLPAALTAPLNGQ
jgi:hypothetical protein